jgi:hypothetical protein
MATIQRDKRTTLQTAARSAMGGRIASIGPFHDGQEGRVVRDSRSVGIGLGYLALRAHR